MFGLNRAEVIGRLGADVTVNHLTSGGRVANMSIATDESYIDRNGGGERIEKTEWHRVVSFQPGLVDMLEKPRQEGPARLRVRQAADAALAQGRRGVRPVRHRDPARPGWSRPVPRQAQRRQRVQRQRCAAARGPGRERACRDVRSHRGRRRHSVLIVRAPLKAGLRHPRRGPAFFVHASRTRSSHWSPRCQLERLRRG